MSSRLLVSAVSRPVRVGATFDEVRSTCSYGSGSPGFCLNRASTSPSMRMSMWLLSGPQAQHVLAQSGASCMSLVIRSIPPSSAGPCARAGRCRDAVRATESSAASHFQIRSGRDGHSERVVETTTRGRQSCIRFSVKTTHSVKRL